MGPPVASDSVRLADLGSTLRAAWRWTLYHHDIGTGCGHATDAETEEKKSCQVKSNPRGIGYYIKII